MERGTAALTYGVAALAGLMFGLDIGAISGAIRFIQEDFGVSDAMIEWIVSSMMMGAAVGALLAGRISASLGRKRSLMAGAALFVAGSALSAAAWSPAALIAGRTVLGLAVGVASFAAPLYLAEVTRSETRGAVISLYQLMITIGIFAAFLSDTALSYTRGWRWMLGVIAFPGALFLIGASFVVDSPRWLMMRGRRREAADVLFRLRGDEAEAKREIAEIEERLGSPREGFRLFRESPDFRRSVGLGLLLQVMQQLTGINVVMYYAPRIFQQMGYAPGEQMWFTAGVGLTNVVATVIAILLVDRWGRKPILYTGFAVMAAALGLVGAMMSAGIASRGEQIFSAAMLLIFIAGFAMSAGPVIWALCSEVQPLKGRDFGVAISTCVNWAANTIIGLTFLSLLSGIGPARTFWLYAGLNLLFIAVTFALVPETKGVTLEQIERNLIAGKPLREIGR